MNRPEPIVTAIEENTTSVAPAVSWGEKEVAREIALLEAHVRQDKITNAVDRALAVLESLDGLGEAQRLSNDIISDCIEETLREGYLDYAESVIRRGQLCGHEAIDVIRTLSRRVMASFPHLTSGLSAALAIFRIERKTLSFASLIKAAKTACSRVPLFAYGPELSEFRHRLR